jgi:hypothetical protein
MDNSVKFKIELETNGEKVLSTLRVDTTMAQQMGIQFDAAAIKAAGGMRNFLRQLDSELMYSRSCRRILSFYFGLHYIISISPLGMHALTHSRQHSAERMGGDTTQHTAFRLLQSLEDFGGVHEYDTFLGSLGEAEVAIESLFLYAGTVVRAVVFLDLRFLFLFKIGACTIQEF